MSPRYAPTAIRSLGQFCSRSYSVSWGEDIFTSANTARRYWGYLSAKDSGWANPVLSGARGHRGSKLLPCGAIFGLIDEAFETAGQTDGTIAVALNVNVTYVSSPEAGKRLRATAQRISRTKKTASYEIKVMDMDGNMIASCQALAYRTGKPIPFI